MAITYKKAGVNIDTGNELVERLKKKLPKIGGFGGLFPIAGTKYNLVSSTDGVGTKLKIAFMLNKHDTVGIDLVAMNVNDLICAGAKPLFFLDYFACGKLNVDRAEQVIRGIAKGCELSGSQLIGGETAEMPDFYKDGEYDLAGFSVGIIEKDREINGSKIKSGDIIIGLPSSGPHSNGYSLIRKVFSDGELKKYSKQLLAPTRIYVKEVLAALAKFNSKERNIAGIAHITGGGFYDKIERILPENVRVVIEKNSWRVPEIFKVIQEKGRVPEEDIYRTLNMGIGMVLIVHSEIALQVKEFFKGAKAIGCVKKGERGVELV
ncbi:phosphoribosylformylglycinamidine cyclo-ligase [Endomicrobiia bacterium]|uniref:phosphoribosylformylglycinamidine cyclo-ligase n=1 Tax=Endomicrobium trichonymphae TaxID=1408204 RepID=UPI002219D3EB|nr:phosphoribosylformylglycinamidine cyclo-ligase [Endomicrobiia bacterium]GMO51437.1 MAG: phosphoribosylformylglycinamidine cyclo-ligase [Candidatus Endomicrobium trichonymphae]GHT12027.1 phosphoribosylformylglycinamidine cyclo-ligase [Endomicrobiia bacterium]GHT20908.1 phosphoribosylformylglycinamidine cyclo-ligase [Endomicrobiia bacterium]GHT26017.1 phosphoribosylformylglycinamidine cyclo-ligase [Endomicrobiia bacterium]